jgi:predicted dehydrogenase
MKKKISTGLNRRNFIRNVLFSGTVTGGLFQILPSYVLGRDGAVSPNEKIIMGGLGIGARGTSVLEIFLHESDVKFVAVADARLERRKAVKQMVDTKYGDDKCVVYDDFRRILDRTDIDILLIATGDRWHSLASILAAKAGKDMYCEKPCSMTIKESIDLRDTIKRYARVYQAGTQRRSVGNFVFAVELARKGKLGKLHTVHANTLHPATTQDWLPEEPLPPKQEVDWIHGSDLILETIQ